jgi:hypothetical protein
MPSRFALYAGRWLWRKRLAMSERAADEFEFIAKRLAEIRKERDDALARMPPLDEDVPLAAEYYCG